MPNKTIAFYSESILWFVLSGSVYDGQHFQTFITDFQQRSIIRYWVFRHKSNYQIQAKLCLVYGKDALYRRTVDTTLDTTVDT
jgi:hypothetical protein